MLLAPAVGGEDLAVNVAVGGVEGDGGAGLLADGADLVGGPSEGDSAAAVDAQVGAGAVGLTRTGVELRQGDLGGVLGGC